MALGENGILEKAINARTKYKQKSAEEKIEIEIASSYDAIEKKYNMEKVKENLSENLNVDSITNYSDDIIKFEFEDQYFYINKDGNLFRGITIEEAQSEENYLDNKIKIVTDNTGKTFVLPGNFRVVEEFSNVDTGVVIQDEKNNEFVWIPVENVVTNSVDEANTTKAMSLLDESTGNYSGIMYDANVEGNKITGSTVRTTNYYEPRLAIYTDTDERLAEYGYTQESFLNEMQTEYNNMVNSVKEYKGFYFARYETSVDNNENVQSKKGVLPYSGGSTNWYTLYIKQKNFYNTTVQSSMIWGSQYDAMLNWAIKGSDRDNILKISRTETEKVITGSKDVDIIKNIYDLTSNTFEWTICRGAELNSREHRGAFFGKEGNALRRAYTVSAYSGDMNGSRMSLYIK